MREREKRRRKKKNTGTESRLKNDNDLHFNIMLSVGCYCDKVLDVSLPNESGCSVMRATKTFGRTCHPLLFSCKWAWEIYLCPPTVYCWNKERLIGETGWAAKDEPCEDICCKKERKKEKRGRRREKRRHSRRWEEKSSEKSKDKSRADVCMYTRDAASDNTWPRNKLEACLDAR